MPYQLLLLCALFAGLAFSGLGLSYKAADSLKCRPMPFLAIFASIGGVISLVFSLFQSNVWNNPFLWLFGFIGGVLLFFAVFFCIRANLYGPASVTWTLLNLSLLVSVAVGVPLFKERFYWIDALTLILFFLMLLAFAHSENSQREITKGNGALFLLFLSGMFISNGFSLMMGKFKLLFFQEASNAGFAMIQYLTLALLALIIYLVHEGRRPFLIQEYKVGAFAGICSSVGLLLFLAAAPLPSLVYYPLTEGIALLGGAALTIIIFQERFDIYKIAGLVLGIAVLFSSVLRGGHG